MPDDAAALEAQRGEDALRRLDELLSATDLPYMLRLDIKLTVSAYGIARELHAIAALKAAGRP